MEKVKVDKKTFNALEKLSKKYDFDKLIELHITNKFRYESEDIEAYGNTLKKLTTKAIAHALLFGFEVEEDAPETIILKEYKYSKHVARVLSSNSQSAIDFSKGKMEGIEFVLETLSIKIPGI